jgi:hypothetical protein
MKTKLALLAALAVSNLLWFNYYGQLSRDYDRTDAYRQWSDSIISEQPDSLVYKIRKTYIGEARVTCLNGGDAAIRPLDEFGQIIVSCGK